LQEFEIIGVVYLLQEPQKKMTKSLILIALFVVAINAKYISYQKTLPKELKIKQDVCKTLEQDLPMCTFLACDSEVIDFLCPFDVFQQNFSIGVGINICAQPINVNFTFYDDGVDLYDTTIDGSISFGIPGLSIDIFDLANAGVYIDIEMDTEPNEFDLKIATQACAGVIGYQLCWPNPPFTIVDIEIPMAGFCNGTETAKAMPIKLAK